MFQIGLLNEKPLHASLKAWYAKPHDRFEVPVDGFVVDIVRGDLLLEIQTRSLSSIKAKLHKLVASHKLRLIYPIAQEKLIVRLAKGEGNELSRRKSPKRGRVEDLFWEMMSFPQLLTNRNFSLDVLMIKEEEVRRYDGTRGWRRRGWITEERRLVEVIQQRPFETPSDWRDLLPKDVDQFTARELAEAMGITTPLAQKMVYCLRKALVIDLVGKQGRGHLYCVNQPEPVRRSSHSCSRGPITPIASVLP